MVFSGGRLSGVQFTDFHPSRPPQVGSTQQDINPNRLAPHFVESGDRPLRVEGHAAAVDEAADAEARSRCRLLPVCMGVAMVMVVVVVHFALQMQMVGRTSLDARSLGPHFCRSMHMIQFADCSLCAAAF